MASSYERIPVDPRVVDKIMRSPSMMEEQGSGFMQSWGGPGAYQQWAREPPGKRMTYFAVQQGATTSGEVAVMTGLKESEVNKWLGKLEMEGLVSIEEEPI